MLIDAIHQHDIVVSTDGHPPMPARKSIFLEAVEVRNGNILKMRRNFMAFVRQYCFIGLPTIVLEQLSLSLYATFEYYFNSSRGLEHIFPYRPRKEPFPPLSQDCFAGSFQRRPIARVSPPWPTCHKMSD